MGKQLELFPAPPPDERERLNAAQAQMRREQKLREATRVHARRGRHRFSTFDAQRFASAELDQ